jgi:hypothetical protein
MGVHIQSRDGAERLGSAALLAAFDGLVVSEYVLEPGTEPGDPHYYANHSDAFYVLEGELEFRIDGRPVRASAGTLVVAPRGVVHAFPVAIGQTARFLNLHTPGGFERYLRTLGEMRARGETPDAELQKAHDSVPRLTGGALPLYGYRGAIRSGVPLAVPDVGGPLEIGGPRLLVEPVAVLLRRRVHLVVVVPLRDGRDQTRVVLVLVDAALTASHLLHHRSELLRRRHETIDVGHLHGELDQHRHGSSLPRVTGDRRPGLS